MKVSPQVRNKFIFGAIVILSVLWESRDMCFTASILHPRSELREVLWQKGFLVLKTFTKESSSIKEHV